MTPKTLDATGVILLVLALIGWLLMAINLSNIVGNNATGDATMGKALSTFGTLAFVALTWVFTGLLLMRAGMHDVLAQWATAVATILFFASGAAAIAAVFLLNDPRLRWPAAIPIAAPLLLIGFVVCGYRGWRLIGGVLLGGLLLISLSPWRAVGRAQARKAQALVEAEQIRAQQAAEGTRKKREENLAQIQQMKPDSHIWDWFSLLENDSGVQQEALAALRTHPNRQADVEYWLGDGISMMEWVPALDLKPTPKLCEAAQHWCAKFADNMRPQNGEPSYYERKQLLAPAMNGLRWFHANGCPLDDGLAVIEAGLHTYADTPHRREMLQQLSELRKP